MGLDHQLVGVGRGFSEQRSDRRIYIRLSGPALRARDLHVPLCRAGAHDGSPVGRDRQPGDSVSAAAEAPLSVADGRHGYQHDHGPDPGLRPADALLDQYLLLGEDGDNDPGCGERTGVSLQHLPVHR